MTRPTHITCACGATRPVPTHGAIPKKCVACQKASKNERRRDHQLAYSRRPDIKERRKRYRELYGPE